MHTWRRTWEGNNPLARVLMALAVKVAKSDLQIFNGSHVLPGQPCCVLSLFSHEGNNSTYLFLVFTRWGAGKGGGGVMTFWD